MSSPRSSKSSRPQFARVVLRDCGPCFALHVLSTADLRSDVHSWPRFPTAQTTRHASSERLKPIRGREFVNPIGSHGEIRPIKTEESARTPQTLAPQTLATSPG